MSVVEYKLSKFLIGTMEYIPLLALSMVIFIATIFVTRFLVLVLERSLKRFALHSATLDLFKRLLAIVIWSLGILLICSILVPSITVAHLFTALGFSTVAIGFAFKDILENSLAGILILARETYDIRDIIKCANHEGRVEKITMHDTHIRTSDGERVVLPNSLLFKNPVRVISPRELKKISVSFSIGHQHNIEDIRLIVSEALKESSSFADENSIEVFAEKFGFFNIEYQVSWWIAQDDDVGKAKHIVIGAIQNALSNKNITLAFNLSHGEEKDSKTAVVSH